MIALNANVRAFNSCVESSNVTICILWFVYLYTYFILSRMAEMLHKRNPTILISLLGSHAFYSLLYLWLTDE